MTKDIIKQTDKLLDKTKSFAQITTRAADPNAKALAEFHIFDEKKLAKIAADMPEINRATRAYGRKNTSTTNRLMTCTMLADSSPYTVIKQCLAQIERKRSAIKENRFKIIKDRIELEKVQDEIKKLPEEPDKNKYEIMLKKVDVEELTSKIADSIIYVEGALKEIASFQSTYKQVCKNKNIPENWDEVDMEKAEVRHHLRMAFLHAYRDIMAHGRLGMGTLEYLQQFGVHPHNAERIVADYIKTTYDNVNKEEADYEDLEKFLDVMEETFKDEYKKVMKRIGIDSLYEDWYMYKED